MSIPTRLTISGTGCFPHFFVLCLRSKILLLVVVLHVREIEDRRPVVLRVVVVAVIAAAGNDEC